MSDRDAKALAALLDKQGKFPADPFYAGPGEGDRGHASGPFGLHFF